MLTDVSLERILARIPSLTFGVVGDLFLDRYLDLDAALTEPSIETGLDAYQVVRVRAYPGAAGTVINNLVALGVQRVSPITVIGDDGEGYELCQALRSLQVVELASLIPCGNRRTPTYTKPLLHRSGQTPRELNRLDIKNRTPLPADAEDQVLAALAETWPYVDGLLVVDQVSEAECGVVTSRVRGRLAELGNAEPEKLILADSRERIGLFQAAWLKPNAAECLGAMSGKSDVEASAVALAEQTGRPVFCTRGASGILLINPRSLSRQTVLVAGYPVSGAIDPVGAGDSTSAGIACALAAGATLEEAAAFGNLVASITIQQLGTTGTATPEQVRRRWQEVRPD